MKKSYSEKSEELISKNIKTADSIIESMVHVSDYCVYFLLKNSKIVYVGQSKNGGFDRIGTHAKYSDKDFDSYYIQPCKECEVSELEAEYILTFSPELNKSIPSNNKYKSISYISRLYKKWDVPKFALFLKSNNIKIYRKNYVDLSEVKQLVGVDK